MVHFRWNSVTDNILCEQDDAGEVLAAYTQQPGPYGELISQRREGNTYFHHYDAQGNTRAVTDESGNVVEAATYSAFGETVAKTTTITNPFGFKGALGYYTNPVTNDLHVRERTLETTAGRWLSPDPLGFLDGPNRYRYALNNPLLFADPSGLACGCCCCVESLALDLNSLTTQSELIPEGWIGYYFELHARVYAKPTTAAKFSGCGLEFWENSTPDFPRSTHGEWRRKYPRAGPRGIGFCDKQPTTKEWCRFFHETCPKYDDHCFATGCGFHHTLRIIDAPAIDPRKFRELGFSQRILFFHVVIRSAEDCGCEKDSLLWEGCQVIVLDAMGRVIKDGRIAEKPECPQFPPGPFTKS